MVPDEPSDWRDAAAYGPLLVADRSLIAWEWLRRDPAYRASARAGKRAVGLGPEMWGLHAYEAPERGVPEARPMWRAEAHPLVLPADGEDAACGSGDALDLALVAGARIVCDGSGEHLLLCDGFRTIRIDVLSGSVALGPVRLRYRLAGLSSAEEPLLTLRRLLAFWRLKRFQTSLHPREARARRWVTMLRAHDALAAGAGQREIAAVLLSGSALEPDWRIRSPSLRLRAQRLVRGARSMAAGEWKALLR